MARFSCGWRTVGAGSTTLPIASLYAPAAHKLFLVEVGVTNTTVTPVSMCLRRATTTGTQGTTTMTILYEDDDSATALGTPKDTHTVAPTLTGTAMAVRNGILGASIGSGEIWTFGGRGLLIPAGTGNGICLIPLVGTGQICDVYFSWDE